MLRRILVSISVLALFAIGIALLPKQHDERRLFDLLPEDLGAMRVVYTKNEAWGFGLPGDNETGVIVYEMSAATAGAVREAGVKFFDRPDGIHYARDKSYYFHTWRQTPVDDLLERIHGQGAPPRTSDSDQPPLPSIASYLNRYGYGIKIDPQIEVFINSALARPGSFVAQGRYGILIVMPTSQRIAFVYAG